LEPANLKEMATKPSKRGTKGKKTETPKDKNLRMTKPTYIPQFYQNGKRDKKKGKKKGCLPDTKCPGLRARVRSLSRGKEEKKKKETRARPANPGWVNRKTKKQKSGGEKK